MPLSLFARKLMEQAAGSRTSTKRPQSLAEFIPAITPHYRAPEPLRAILECFDRIARGETVEQVNHAPPQHGKSDSILHGIAYLLKHHPEWPVQYISYNQDIANAKSTVARRLATEAGITFQVDSNRMNYWRTTQGGGLLAAGIGQGAGFPAQVVIVDDPYKERREADSAANRKHTEDWFRDVALARRRQGGSVIINSTRWHPKDLSGVFIAEGWPYFRLPAIQDRPPTDYDPRPEGAPLWPELKSLEWLEKQKGIVGEFGWASVWQGNPRPRGAAVFHDPTYYQHRPQAFRTAIGFDLAYTSSTSADYSVAIALAQYASVTYVLEVIREQVEAPVFGAKLHDMQTRWRAPALIYIGVTEKGTLQYMRRHHNVNVHAITAGTDKFTRAQNVAAAWNAGRVLVPQSAPWLDAFLDELGDFTGVNDEHDDQVDALAAGFDYLDKLRGGSGSTRPRRSA
jgi:predicted phage terminase large subunit-like protein